MYIHLPNAVTDDLHSEQCNFWSTSISVFQSRNDHSAQNTVISVCFKCPHSVCIVNRRIRLSWCAVSRYVFLSPLLCHLPPLHLKVFFACFFFMCFFGFLILPNQGLSSVFSSPHCCANYLHMEALLCTFCMCFFIFLHRAFY